MLGTSFDAPSTFHDLFLSSSKLSFEAAEMPSTEKEGKESFSEKRKRVRGDVVSKVFAISKRISKAMDKNNSATLRKARILKILGRFPNRNDWYNHETKVKARSRNVKYSSWKCYKETFLRCFVALMKSIVSDRNIRWRMEKYTISDSHNKKFDELITSPEETSSTPNVDRKEPVKMPKDRQCYVCRCRFVSSTERRKHAMDPGFSKYLGVTVCKDQGAISVVCLACACLGWLNGISIEPNKVNERNMPTVKCRHKACKGDGWSILDLQYMLVKRKEDADEIKSPLKKKRRKGFENGK